METVELKLKQASAVLGIWPKDLQNLVQFGVVTPKRKADRYWFDNRALLQAKVAWYLKEALGVSTGCLIRILREFSRTRAIETGKATNITIRCRLSANSAVIEVRIPLRRLAGEISEQLPRAAVFKDLPRGRRRPGWKQEFLRAVQAAAAELGAHTEQEIRQTIRDYRHTRKATPEITVVAEARKKTG